MKENNEVVKGIRSVDAVLSAEKDTKKLNAGIALVCLGSYLDDGMITQEQFNRISRLAEKCMNTSVMVESEVNDAEYIEHAIAYIEEYLQEQGV